MFNNAIRDHHGQIIGYKCSVCEAIKNKMWGTVCNECQDRRELIKTIKRNKAQKHKGD